ALLCTLSLHDALPIYPVRNAYEAVADVPDLIVLLAGVTNKAERAVQRIVDASAAHPYENEAGGVSFELLLNATTDRTFSSNYYRSEEHTSELQSRENL